MVDQAYSSIDIYLIISNPAPQCPLRNIVYLGKGCKSSSMLILIIKFLNDMLFSLCIHLSLAYFRLISFINIHCVFIIAWLLPNCSVSATNWNLKRKRRSFRNNPNSFLHFPDCPLE